MADVTGDVQLGCSIPPREHPAPAIPQVHPAEQGQPPALTCSWPRTRTPWGLMGW